MMINSQEIRALINLLDDPDREVFDNVLNRLVELGEPALLALEEQWERSLLVHQQEKLEDVITQIQFIRLKNEIIGWRSSGGENLLYGAYLVACIQYPELKYENLNNIVSKIHRDIWLELNNELTALEKIKVINHFMFNIHGFEKTSKKNVSSQLFLINHLLETKKGSPIIMGLLYAEISRRLELPVYGVNLPGNFILCYYDDAYIEDPNCILFYINPFNYGAVLGRKELEYYLNESGIEPNPSYFAPCSNIDIVERLILNLRHAYDQAKQTEKVNQLDELLLILRENRL